MVSDCLFIVEFTSHWDFSSIIDDLFYSYHSGIFFNRFGIFSIYISSVVVLVIDKTWFFIVKFNCRRLPDKWDAEDP